MIVIGDDFSDPLGGAHDAGRVNGLVRRDEDELAGSVLMRAVEDIFRAGDVVLHRLGLVVLHERNVLVRRGVEHDVRPVLAEHGVKEAAVLDVGDAVYDLRLALKKPGVLVEDLDQVVDGKLAPAHGDELLDVELQQLPAYLRADAPTRPGDEDGLAGILLFDHAGIDPDLLASDKVSDADVPEGYRKRLPLVKLQNMGQHLDGHGAVIAPDVRSDPVDCIGPDGRHGDDDFIDSRVPDHPVHVVGGAEHRLAVEDFSDLARVIVGESGDELPQPPSSCIQPE